MARDDKALKELYRQRGELNERISAIETAEAEAETRPLIGRYFKYRNNYSCPEGPDDYWWLYVKVTGCEGRAVQGFSFQRAKDGRSSAEAEYHGYIHSGGYVEIDGAEYDAAWSTFIGKLIEDAA